MWFFKTFATETIKLNLSCSKSVADIAIIDNLLAFDFSLTLNCTLRHHNTHEPSVFIMHSYNVSNDTGYILKNKLVKHCDNTIHMILTSIKMYVCICIYLSQFVHSQLFKHPVPWKLAAHVLQGSPLVDSNPFSHSIIVKHVHIEFVSWISFISLKNITQRLFCNLINYKNKNQKNKSDDEKTSNTMTNIY